MIHVSPKEGLVLVQKEVLAFRRPRDGRCLLFQIEPNNQVTFLSSDGTEVGHTRPLTSVDEAKRFATNYARSEGFNEKFDVKIPEKITSSF